MGATENQNAEIANALQDRSISLYYILDELLEQRQQIAKMVTSPHPEDTEDQEAARRIAFDEVQDLIRKLLGLWA